jgi:hypothetical protein
MDEWDERKGKLRNDRRKVFKAVKELTKMILKGDEM